MKLLALDIFPALLTIAILCTFGLLALIVHRYEAKIAHGLAWITGDHRERAWIMPLAAALMWVLLAVAIACGIGGCTTWNTAVAPQVAKAVNRYCMEPRDARMVLRSQVQGMTAPNSIQVNCAVDDINRDAATGVR